MRPSSGAGSTEWPDAPDFIASPLLSNIAAPEDGRTPPRHSPAGTDPLLIVAETALLLRPAALYCLCGTAYICVTTKLFSELGLSSELLKAIDKLGFEQAAPIQAEAIPVLMQGKDVVWDCPTTSLPFIRGGMASA